MYCIRSSAYGSRMYYLFSCSFSSPLMMSINLFLVFSVLICWSGWPQTRCGQRLQRLGRVWPEITHAGVLLQETVKYEAGSECKGWSDTKTSHGNGAWQRVTGRSYFILRYDNCKVNIVALTWCNVFHTSNGTTGPMHEWGCTQCYCWSECSFRASALSFMGRLSCRRFQCLHIIALRSSVCATHIICQSWIDLHGTPADYRKRGIVVTFPADKVFVCALIDYLSKYFLVLVYCVCVCSLFLH